MRRIFTTLILLAASALAYPTIQKTSSAAPEPTPLPSQPQYEQDLDRIAQLESAIFEAIRSHEDSFIALAYDEVDIVNLQMNDDETWAIAWLALLDPQTGEILPSEPALVLAKWNGVTWTVALPLDPHWREWLKEIPTDIMSPETRDNWLWQDLEFHVGIHAGPYGGYLLPWEGGRTVSLSRSVGHDASFPSGNAHYSFDFYIPKTMYNIHASKGGTVWMYRDSVPNNEHNSVNYLVLEDKTTFPTTYQLYLHLAQNSIPLNLKTIGTPVTQGQFIGVADNTGQSTGHHLHFQVESSPYWIYWGRSLDILFDDVDINGGRPRVYSDFKYCTWAGDVCEEYRNSYTSGNQVSNPPTGGITSPVNAKSITRDTVQIRGWAVDENSEISAINILANFNDSWNQIGPTFKSSPFSYTWNMCDDRVPDGPVTLALEIQSKNGNRAHDLPGLRNILKNFTCPTSPPACKPTEDQIAVYADPEFKGRCSLLGKGNHPTSSAFGEVGNDNIESIVIGSNVQATLFSNQNFISRGETFTAKDSNLSDNVTGSNTTSSISVKSGNHSPSIPKPLGPLDGSSFQQDTSISLVWENAGESTHFQVQLSSGGITLLTSPWIDIPYLHLGSLQAGTYTWKVRAKNGYGVSNWSPGQQLNISSSSNPGASHSVPYIDDMENGYNDWDFSDYWDQSMLENHTTGGKISWKYEVDDAISGYDNGKPNSGDLSSPSIFIPEDSAYFLRFWYLYDTEGSERHWDQRWVQISVNGGTFSNTLQLYDDQSNIWLRSPAIDLSSFSGKTIRVRFHFETLDNIFNTKEGWYIDDFSITDQSPPTCSESTDPGDYPSDALLITYNNNTTSFICPGGDLDYFKFVGLKGDQIGISTEAQSIGSALDTYIFLLDSDGRSILNQNDDKINANLTDSYLSHIIPRDDIYFIKVRSWNHPTAGGDDHSYDLKIHGLDFIDPSATFIFPKSGASLPKEKATITIAANDGKNGSGISHVQFFFHTDDWNTSKWEYLGEDWDGRDGWNYTLDLTKIKNKQEIALYAKVFDWAGNWISIGSWNLSTSNRNFLPLVIYKR